MDRAENTVSGDDFKIEMFIECGMLGSHIFGP